MRGLLTALALICAGSVSAQEFTTLKGHGGPIMAIDVLPDGRVVTASFDNSVGVWNGTRPEWLEGHSAAVNAVAAGPGLLVSGGDDFSVLRWDLPTWGIPLGVHKGKVTDIAISPDNATVASASWDGRIGLWSVTTGENWALSPPSVAPRGRFLDAPGGVNAVAFADPSRLYAGTSDGILMLFDLKEGAGLPLVQNGFGINELIVTEAWIAYGAVDGTTRIIDHEGNELADFTLDRRPILALAYHAETGQLGVGDGEGYIMIVDTKNWRIARDFRAARQGPVWALAFSPDGQTIYAGGLDDVVYAWPVALLDRFEPGISGARSFLRPAEEMTNGERQFMRKCSICHALEPGPSRKAGPTLHGLFGRQAGVVAEYSYSTALDGAGIIWTEKTVDALFDQGPDHYIPGSKMPMQVIAGADDRADLIEFLKGATQ